ncbi:MAG: patatin-like phospholipase family protein [Kineosporiaceae bacterium]
MADVDAHLAARLLAADVVVDTSAGSSVAPQITSGLPLGELYMAQLRAEIAEIKVEIDGEQLWADYAAATAGASGPEDVGRRLGSLALAARTVDPALRLAAVDARLARQGVAGPTGAHPGGGRRDRGAPVFTRESGVPLVDAVTASCAVPGVWPPVTIDGRRYIDGGARSITNADLAAGADRVVVVRPVLEGTPQPLGDLDDDIASLAPAAVHVISADEASVAAFGVNPLSPATRGPSARAGRALGVARAAAVAALWS